MATTAKRVKDAKEQGRTCPACRGKGEVEGKACACKNGKVFTSRKHNRCHICGRPRGYLRKFGICRLCFRGLALRGEIPGVAKSSW